MRVVNDIPKRAGIYKITCIVNGKIYIGSAVNLYQRWQKHKSDLIKNKHANNYLQNSFNKYGEDKFLFEVVEYVDKKENLIEREQFWIDNSNCCDRNIGFNIAPKAGSQLGYRHSEESLMKMSINRTGIGHTEETKKKMSESRKGLTHTEQTKILLSKKLKGRIITDEWRANISKSQKGRPRRHTLSEEAKQKISEANSGRIRSDVWGSKNNMAKLNEEDIVTIKNRIKNYEKLSDIAKDYNMNLSVIYDIKNGVTWKHVLPDLDLSDIKHINSKLNEDEVREIRKLIQQGMKLKDIADIFGVSDATIGDIKRFKTWKNIHIEDEVS